MNTSKLIAKAARVIVRAVAPEPYLPPYVVYPGTLEHWYCLRNLEMCGLFAYWDGVLTAVIEGER